MGYGSVDSGVSTLNQSSRPAVALQRTVSTSNLETFIAKNWVNEIVDPKSLGQTYLNLKRDVGFIGKAVFAKGFDKGFLEDMQNVLDYAFKQTNELYDQKNPKPLSYDKFKQLQDQYEVFKRDYVKAQPQPQTPT